VSRRSRESRNSPQLHGKRKLRNCFKVARRLFLRPLKRLAPEYTPATSKGKPSWWQFLKSLSTCFLTQEIPLSPLSKALTQAENADTMLAAGKTNRRGLFGAS
jgi:hypothetical protein